MLVAAFGFAPRSGRGIWTGWPAAELVLPRQVAIRTRAGQPTWLITHDTGSGFRTGTGDGDGTGTGDGTGDGDGIGIGSGASRPQWNALVERALAAIADGEVTKLVLARRQSVWAAAGRRYDALATARRIAEVHPRSTAFLWRHGDGSCFVGATPETLVRVDAGQLVTDAVAGTIARGSDAGGDRALAAELLCSAKNRGEHQVAVASISASLGPLCGDLDLAAGPHVRTLGNLQHLVTPIRGRLHRAHGILDAVEALHPTAALAGWPRREASTWLERHEDLERGWYGGPIGWLSADGGHFVVAIRCALLRPGVAHAFTGAGIVPGSCPDAEWRETELKVAPVVRALTTRYPLEGAA